MTNASPTSKDDLEKARKDFDWAWSVLGDVKSVDKGSIAYLMTLACKATLTHIAALEADTKNLQERIRHIGKVLGAGPEDDDIPFLASQVKAQLATRLPEGAKIEEMVALPDQLEKAMRSLHAHGSLKSAQEFAIVVMKNARLALKALLSSGAATAERSCQVMGDYLEPRIAGAATAEQHPRGCPCMDCAEQNAMALPSKGAATPAPTAIAPGGDYSCPCGMGDEPCPGPDGRLLCDKSTPQGDGR